jgi:AbrB family looped-hinge helix DNA binding protein
MANATLRKKGQLTLPREVREAAHLDEGDTVRFEVVDDGTVLLHPQRMIDASQAWFWSPAWQEGERAATADIAAGRTTRFLSDEDFLASLDD